MSPLALLLLAATPLQEDAGPGAGPQAPPRLPAPLAWLVDQDDYPRVSRHLVVLEPGAETPDTALDGLLYCFDAADHQRVAWCGDLLLVNGARPRTRPAPNVDLPLSALRRTESGWQAVAPWHQGAAPAHYAPAPDGSGVLLWSLQRVGYLPAGESRADAVHWLLTPEDLGRAQVRSATWSDDSGAVLVSVAGWRDDGMADGLWRLDPQRRGDPVRVDAAQGVPRAAWPGGGLLATRRNGRDFYASRSLLLVRPGTGQEPQVLVDDLHWNESFAVEPDLAGRPDRPRIAFVCAAADASLGAAADTDASPGARGAVMLREEAADGSVQLRELWRGPHEASHLAWSPDGRWLAFHARDAERKPWVWALEVASGEAHRLGRGLRPAWGPLPPADAPASDGR